MNMLRRIGLPVGQRERRVGKVPIPRAGTLKGIGKVAREDRTRNLLLAGAAGALLAFFLDPDRGKRRRKVSRDRVGAAVRGAARQVGRLGRRTASDTYGLAQKITHLKPERPPDLEDAGLAQKVQTELFRDPDVPKGRINVNVEHGIVVLRGEVDRPEQVRELEERARGIPGVKGVESLLHMVNTPAPNPPPAS